MLICRSHILSETARNTSQAHHELRKKAENDHSDQNPPELSDNSLLHTPPLLQTGNSICHSIEKEPRSSAAH
jgi:hypothetical protein